MSFERLEDENGKPVLKCSICGERIVVHDGNIPFARMRHTCRFRGAGDLIAGVTSALGIRPCRRCKRRQERLNRLIPFR